MKELSHIEEGVEKIRAGRKADRVFIITDTVVSGLAPDFLPWLPRFEMKPGEDNKTIRQAEEVWNFLEREGATRKSLVVNLGGGIVSDLGGFAASTFKRGIGYLNVATTLLAAVDAAIGGKTAVNFGGLKNEVGVFALPLATFPATFLFRNLPESEMLSGYGEMLKTGLLSGPELFRVVSHPGFLEKPDAETFDRAVKACAEFKEHVVEKDFREGGLRKILNLGHTAGHAYEMVLLEKGRPVPHGVAVAYGILTAIILSRLVLGVSADLMHEYVGILKDNFPRIDIGCQDMERIIGLIGHDKKNSEIGRPKFVLLEDVGKPVIDVEPTAADLKAAIEMTIDHIG